MSNPALAGAPGRYAAALFSLAEESGSLDAVSADMEFLEKALREGDLRFALANPDFSRADKQRALEKICEQAGAHRLTRNTIGVLVGRGRIGLLGEVAAGFAALRAARRNEQEAEIVSAKPLSEEEQARMKAMLEQASGGKIRLACRVDEDLLAGMSARVGSLLADGSLRAKLNNLANAMKEKQ